MFALTLSRGGTSRLGVYIRDSLSGGTSQHRKIGCYEGEILAAEQDSLTMEGFGFHRMTKKGP